MVNQNGQTVKDRMIPYVQKKTGGPEEPPANFSNNFVGVSLWKQRAIIGQRRVTIDTAAVQTVNDLGFNTGCLFSKIRLLCSIGVGNLATHFLEFLLSENVGFQPVLSNL